MSDPVWFALILAVGTALTKVLDWLIAEKSAERAERSAERLEHATWQAGSTTQTVIAETGQTASDAAITTAADLKKQLEEVGLIAAADLKKQLDTVAENNKERDATVTKKLDEIAKVGKISHDLSNSASLATKRLLMEASQGRADATNDPADRLLAARDKESYEAHLAGQVIADKKEKESDAILAEAVVKAADKLAAAEKDK